MYREIITRLGATRDLGSGLHVALYIVDDKENLYLSIVDPDLACTKSGTELLQSAQPIVDESDKIGMSSEPSLLCERILPPLCGDSLS